MVESLLCRGDARRFLRPKRGILVVGYMHSGTTLLLNILKRNPRVYSTHGETKFFERLPAIQWKYRDLTNPDTLTALVQFVASVVEGRADMSRLAPDPSRERGVPPSDLAPIADALQGGRDHAEVFGAVLDYLTHSAGRERWLEKTPTHVFDVDRILRSIPDVQFVQIVRDPRDVLASKKTRRETVWTSNRYLPDQRSKKHLEKAYDPLWDSLSWKAAIRAGQAARQKYPAKVFTIRYEDLVSDPESRVREACDFLDLAFEPGMLGVSRAVPADPAVAARKGMGGISRDSVGRWKTVLSPSEAVLCQILTSGEMRLLGYTPTPTRPMDKLKAPKLIAKSSVEFFQRLSRRWRLGGTRYLSTVMINYGKRLVRSVAGLRS